MVETADKPAPRKTSRGKYILLALVGALAAYLLIAQVGLRLFNPAGTDPAIAKAADEASQASAAWLSYLSQAGIADTEAGKAAAAELDKGTSTRLAGDGESALRHFQAAWQGYLNAFRAEGKLASELYEQRLAGPWREKLRGKFPFDITAEVEADPADLAALISPIDGALWLLKPRLDAIVAARVGEQKFFDPPPNMAAFVAAAGAAREKLFIPGRAELTLWFEGRTQPGPYATVVLELSGASVGHETSTITWTQGMGGCKVVATGHGGSVREIDYSTSQWGAMRLLSSIHTRADSPGALVFLLTQLEVSGQAPTLEIKSTTGEHPFDVAMFSVLATGP